jgi:ribosomal protein S18 acetylase RimI-like enzyme
MQHRYTTSTDVLPTVSELAGLFAQAHWALQRSHDDIARLLENTKIFVVVSEGASVIGFGRALTDGVFRALLDDIIVDQAHRGRGLGHMIVDSLMKQVSTVEEVLLHTDHDLEGFYSSHGFREYAGLAMKIEPRPAPDAGQSRR